jgi:hypothetical protein
MPIWMWCQNIGSPLSGIARTERQVPARHPAAQVPFTRVDAKASGDGLGVADRRECIKLSSERNEQIPEYMRNADGWYEEDEQWGKVAVVFPDAFPSGTVVEAYGTLKNWHPEAYEKFTGKTLKPGESFMRDRQLFQREHADSLVVVSACGAWASWVPKDFVGCHACVGGRGERGQTNGVGRAFLVPAAEYDVRSQHGFVIDPAKWIARSFVPVRS